MEKDTKGKRFEKQVLNTLKNMGIDSYGANGQIPLCNLYSDVSSDENLEIDIVCLVKGVCILIETTTKQDKHKDKIKDFIRKCELIRECELDKRTLFSLFEGIDNDSLPAFSGISEWRYLYIGTSHKLSTGRISAKNFPETELIYIFDESNWEYFRALEKAINKTAQYEFFASLEITPDLLNDPVLGSSLQPKPCLHLKNITLAKQQVQANLAVAFFTPQELLRIARVSRYQGQPLTVSDTISKSQGESSNLKDGGYQRLLSDKKLKDLSDFVDNNPDITFPTNLTLVLSNECTINGDFLNIPAKYASVDIIDGQHRLFSYTVSGNEKLRNEGKLIVTAIKFLTEKPGEINQYAAQTFVTINREQTKIKRELMLMISYDVLGEKTPEAIASKILKMCDSKPNGVLERVFAVRALIKKNKFGKPPIPIISVIEQLARITKPDNINSIKTVLDYQSDNKNEAGDTCEDLIKHSVTLLERYFSLIRKVFEGDWGNYDSFLMSAKYFGAFIRLLEKFVETHNTIDEIETELAEIKKNILTRFNHGRDSNLNIVFNSNAYSSTQDILPSKSSGSIKKILDFLNENRKDNFKITS